MKLYKRFVREAKVGTGAYVGVGGGVEAGVGKKMEDKTNMKEEREGRKRN